MPVDLFEPHTLRTLLLAGLAVVAIGVYTVLRFVSNVALRLVLVVVFVGIGLGLWVERAELADCAQGLEQCTFLGREVVSPGAR